jgi:uncharacterized protein
MSLQPDPNLLLELCKTPMPFGKYSGRMISDIPVHYLEWMSTKGFPKGKLGMLLETILVIKMNGLESLLDPIKKME